MRTYKHVIESGFNVIQWREGNAVGFYKEGQDLYSEAMATGEVVMLTQGEIDAIDKEATRLTAKQVRDSALNAMTYTFSDGREIQTRLIDQALIMGAINRGGDEWILADDTLAQVTAEELAEALLAAEEKVSIIFDAYKDAIR